MSSDHTDDRPDSHVPDVSPDIPPLHWRAMLHLLRHLPQGALSRGFGAVADLRLPSATRQTVLQTFARMMHIDVSEAEHALPHYRSINEFFVRRLRVGARSVDAREDTVVSPVDGVVGQFGTIHQGRLLQAKGRTYTAVALLGDESPDAARAAARFDGGTFMTIYLSPRHYHRIHSPVDGAITNAAHVPGALLPVNAPSVQYIAELFPRNERLICDVRTTHGAAVIVAVGAYNVGRISAAFDPGWCDGGAVTNRAGALYSTRKYEPPIPVRRGAEIMAFHLGSTVVLLFEQSLRLDARIIASAEVRMGSSIGVWTHEDRA